MKAKILVLIAIFCLIFAGNLRADSTLVISGMQIPLMEGATPKQEAPQRLGGARVAVYSLDAALEDVVSYYESFIKDNGFAVIGGRVEQEFNASVRKGDVLFTLKISPKGKKTLVEFVW